MKKANFFLDNLDLRNRFSDDVHCKLLEIIGEISASEISEYAPLVDEEGPSFSNGEIDYHPLTLKIFELFGKSGLYGMTIPKQYGGLELPMSVFLASIEIISRADPGFGALWSLQACSETINDFASEEIKDYWLPRLSQGATAAMALTEPDAGSDLQAVRLRASQNPDWKLNGVKRFITNGNADMVLVLARSEEGTMDGRGLSLFVYDKRDGNVRYRRLENKMGIKTSTTLEMEFVDAPARLIGSTRLGLIKYVMALMNGARLAVAAQSVGIAEAAYREALQYASSRKQFSVPVKELPQIRHILDDMNVRLLVMRALLYETGYYVDMTRKCKDDRILSRKSRQIADALTPLSKFITSEFANKFVYDSLQVHGGVGYMRGTVIERLTRDARVTSIYEGTSQMQVQAIMSSIQKETYINIMKPVPERLKNIISEYSDALALDVDKNYESRLLVEMTAYIVMAFISVKNGLSVDSFILDTECFISYGHKKLLAKGKH